MQGRSVSDDLLIRAQKAVEFTLSAVYVGRLDYRQQQFGM